MAEINLIECLKYINPTYLDYQEWVNIGMALKHEGYSVNDWDNWSKQDSPRYHAGECERKWETFQGNSSPVTAGTIVSMAKEGGWKPYSDEDYALDWDSEIGSHDDYRVVDTSWIDSSDFTIPETWEPVTQIVTYLETLFDSTETVGFVTDTWQNDNGKHLPTKGTYTMTAGEIIEKLNKCDGDIGKVLGDYNPDAGAWIRFNPLDGNGVKNDNVTEFRYALVESDAMDLGAQKAIINELELPVACLVYSGGKSLHAIVKIDAGNKDEYRKRVEFLYSICKKNGLVIDSQNKNPSRLSRMPGVMRNGKKQYLLETNTGKEDWNTWREWIESINDDLPDPENMESVWENLPELSPPLIDGVLRQGHKMLVAGPSKAGKSFALIELCCALAEGVSWLGFNCTQGKVLYVNLELDRPSCLHRFKDVYTHLRLQPKNIKNIDIWNLRGKSIPMDKLAPKLIRRAAKKNYIAIVIDPIYKVITGDENSADQMAHFCNQFDKVCNELGCAIIYCHHHSKGAQGGKQSMDRASGSGVFARDPDALLDLIELPITDAVHEQECNNVICEMCIERLTRFNIEVDNVASEDEQCKSMDMITICRHNLPQNAFSLLQSEISTTREKLLKRSAWRIEGTLREYPKFAPLNLWFDYPVHRVEVGGVLQDVEPSTFNSKNSPYQQNFKKKKSDKERKKEQSESLNMAYEASKIDGSVTVKEVAGYLGISEDAVRKRIKNSNDFKYEKGFIFRISEQ